MARGGRRNSTRKTGLLGRLYSPVGHLFSAGEESVGAVTNTAKGVVGTTFRGVNKIGRSVTGHANMAISELLTGKSRRNRKNNARKSRRANRKSRRNTRRANRK